MKNDHKIFHAFALQNRFKFLFGTGILIILAAIFTIDSTSGSEDCNNGIDDDGDELVDCQDPDCNSSFNCLMGENAVLYESSSWTSSGSNYLSSSGSINITASGTATGNGRFSATPTGQYSNSDFWVTDLKGHASFETLFTWDTLPEHSTSSIDVAGDDKANGTLTFTFSEPVTNPVLHIERLGGSGYVIGDATQPDTISNSIMLTLQTSGISLVEVAGTDDFETTTTTIRRIPNINTTFDVESYTSANRGTAAGSVVLVGTFTEVVFDWDAHGVEGIGGDGVEFIWSVNIPGSLPVEWLGIQARWDQKSSIIDWQTAREENVAAFRIERKVGDQGTFEEIGEVEATGFSTNTQSYTFADKEALYKANGANILYYRIKQTDFDGKFEYSDAVELRIAESTLELKLFPNPATDNVKLEVLDSGPSAPTQIIVFNTSGQVVMSETIPQDQYTLEWNVSGWTSGTYIIKGTHKGESITQKLVVK